jgi:1,2-diacylglycerol 3-alpha-glucosyltransferase
MRIAIIFINILPYHAARLNTLACMKKEGMEIYGIEISENQFDHKTGNKVFERQYNHITIFSENFLTTAEEQLSNIVSISLVFLLNKLKPDIIAIPGYSFNFLRVVLRWAKKNGKTAILMSDSKEDDYPRTWWKEKIKGLIVKRFDSAIVGGTIHKDYLIKLGFPSKKIVLGYDVIDNKYYQKASDEARRNKDYYKDKYKLPDKYFIAIKRFVPEKNIFFLLDAYKRYSRSISNPWNLVICGNGPLENDIREYIHKKNINGVYLPGFVSIKILPIYLGLSSCLVHASKIEQWGLVVNEAMASGLPVLVSKICGCAFNLVKEGINGFMFDPNDGDQLTSLMLKISSGNIDINKMGKASTQIIAEWTPVLFGRNFMKAVEIAQAKN